MLTLEERDFLRITAFVQKNYGINLIKKRALIHGRLALDIERRGYPSFTAYFDEVILHPQGTECQYMIDKLSTNHTYFFREPGCLEHMRDVAVPALIRRGVKKINIWCAASSTGQECYSLAMMLEEALAMHCGVTYHILGSDVNLEVLETAKAGIYADKELTCIPVRFQQRYCRRYDETHFEIAETLKKRITWRQINLARPLTGLPAFHLIFCRNVMIYFDAAAKEALTSELHRLVEADGYVYVGNTETLDMKRTRFRYLSPSIFEKRRTEE